MSYQNTLCLSSNPRHDGTAYPQSNPLSEHVTDVQVPKVEEQAEGEATIEVRVDLKPRIQITMLTDRRHIQWSSTETAARSEDTL